MPSARVHCIVLQEMFAEEDNDDEEDDGNLTKPQFDYNPEIDDNDGL